MSDTENIKAEKTLSNLQKSINNKKLNTESFFTDKIAPKINYTKAKFTRDGVTLFLSHGHLDKLAQILTN